MEISRDARGDFKDEEVNFVTALKRRGLVTKTPFGLPENESRRRFERIEVKDEPLSETIIKERKPMD